MVVERRDSDRRPTIRPGRAAARGLAGARCDAQLAAGVRPVKAAHADPTGRGSDRRCARRSGRSWSGWAPSAERHSRRGRRSPRRGPARRPRSAPARPPPALAATAPDWPSRARAVADEGELAADTGGRALVDHPADRVRKGRVAHAVEHHLGDRRLARLGLQRRLVVDRLGQAGEGAVAFLAGRRSVRKDGGGRARRRRRSADRRSAPWGRPAPPTGGSKVQAAMAEIQPGPARRPIGLRPRGVPGFVARQARSRLAGSIVAGSACQARAGSIRRLALGMQPARASQRAAKLARLRPARLRSQFRDEFRMGLSVSRRKD